MTIHEVLVFMLYVIDTSITAVLCCVTCTDLLEKWEVPPLSEVNKQLDKLDRALRKQDDAVGELRWSLLC